MKIKKLKIHFKTLPVLSMQVGLYELPIYIS